MAGTALRLTQWLQDAGVWLGDVDIVPDHPCGVRVLAGKDLSPDTKIATIPKSAVLSILTTKISALLADAQLGGGVALTLAVMIERALGPASKWAGYLASCPSRAPIPIFWDERERALLDGTEQEGVAEGELEALQQDYETLVVPLLQQSPMLAGLPKTSTNFDAFAAAASLVSSRAFFVDNSHGDAMVPLADAFNHRSVVIELPPGAEIEELAAEDSVLVPGTRGEDSASLNITISNNEELDRLEIALVNTPVPAGGEIFNTYGELSNGGRSGGADTCVGALLAKYGFTESSNPHDCVTIDPELIYNGLSQVAGEQAAGVAQELLSSRPDIWEDVLEEGFEIGLDGELPQALLFLVHVALPGGKPRVKSAGLVQQAERFEQNTEDAVRS